MHVTLVRTDDDGKRTLGKIFINGVFECFSLEDTYRSQKVKGQTRIPCGNYNLALRMSPKFTPRFNHEMIWLQNVPGFEFILIHPGNKESDTDGCILVGQQVFRNEALTSSRAAYDKLYDRLGPAIKEAQKPVIFSIVDLDRSP